MLWPTSDFRGLYCSLLEQWLGHEAATDRPWRGATGAGSGDEVSRNACRECVCKCYKTPFPPLALTEIGELTF